jgi:hypothetical protein
MVAAPSQNATRAARSLTGPQTGADHPEAPEQRRDAGGRTGLVLRLELPDVDADDRQPTRDHSKPPGVRASDTERNLRLHRVPTPEDDVDPDRVARAVEELLHALVPALSDRVRVEVSLPSEAPGTAFQGPTATLAPLAAARAPSDLSLDLDGRSLSVEGRTVALTRREFDLLAYLDHRRGVALSRRELMNAVWGTGYLDGDRTIDVHVRRLRMKLGPHAERLRTLRGYGYRLD